MKGVPDTQHQPTHSFSLKGPLNKVLKIRMAIEKCQNMFSFAQPGSRDNIRIQKKLLSKMHLFQNRPELLNKEKYMITSDVDPEVVDLFFSRVGGDTDAAVTSENAEQLRELCDELGFVGFDDEIRAHLGGNWKLQKDILGLRGQVDRHDVVIEELQRRVFDLERQILEQRRIPERVNAVEMRVDEIRRSDVAGAIAEAKKDAEEAKKATEKLQKDVTHLGFEVARCERATEAAVDRHALDKLRVEITDAKKDAEEAQNEAEKLHDDVRCLEYEVNRLKARPERVAGERVSEAAVDPQFIDDLCEAIAEAKKVADKVKVDVRCLKYEVKKLKARPEPVAYEPALERVSKADKLKQDVRCLKYEVKRLKAHQAQVVSTFVYNKAKPLNGIIAHLTRECGGNVHDKGVVEVTASINGEYAKRAVDLGTNSPFYSKCEPNQWILYDFKGQRVAPTSYSIRSGQHGYPKSWVLEVSNDETDIGSDPRRRNMGQFLRITPDGHAFHVDGKKWVVVDRRKDNFDLNDRHVTRNFGLSTPPSGAFRFVRLRLTGKNHHGDHYLRIGALELFGALSSQ